jgi:hypothetical protein
VNEGPPPFPDGPVTEEQNWLRRLPGGNPAKANLPFLVHHWLMIYAVPGTSGQGTALRQPAPQRTFRYN